MVLPLGHHEKPLRDTWKQIKAKRTHRGYCYVNLRRDAKGFTRHIHRLVLENFIGPPPEGMEGCHGDGDPSNNRLDNLRWDTHLANFADSVRHGTTPQGARNWSCKIKPETVGLIFELRKLGMIQADIGQNVGLSRNHISRILSGKSWKHLKACQNKDL